MSYEGERFTAIPSQSFEGMCLDEAVAWQIAADIDPENSEGYEAAGAWAELLSETALESTVRNGLAKVDVRQLGTHLQEAVVEPLPEDSLARSRTSQFVYLLTSGVLTDSDVYTSGPSSRSYHRWAYQPEAIGAYVARKLEYDALGGQGEALAEHIRLEAPNLPTAAMSEQALQLKAITERISKLEEDQYYDRPDSIWARRRFTPQLRLDSGLTSFHAGRLERQASMAMARADFGEVLDQTLDQVEVDPAATEKYGAKGAHLLHLNTVLDVLKSKELDVVNVINIPPFMLMDTEAYETYRSGGKLTEAVSRVQQWIRDNDPTASYVVRSSAVKSEDGEHTGAGLYDSVLLPPRANLTGIYKAIKQVYDSVDSPQAVAYCQDIGVNNESMGIVIQQLAEADLDSVAMVTVNSQTPHVPQLADYTIETGPHPLHPEPPLDAETARRYLPLDRGGIIFELGTLHTMDNWDAPRFHVPPDTKTHYVMDSWLAAQAAVLAEKVLGHPVQLEAVLSGNGNRIDIVQARPIPHDWLVPHEFVGFPEEEAWFEGRGVGVYNGQEATIMRTLPSIASLNRRSGLVMPMWDNSFAKGDLSKDYLERLSQMTPEQRARIICLVTEEPEYNRHSGTGYGHLETLFAEMGVGMVFADSNSVVNPGFTAEQKVRVYSNGYRAKIYSDSNDPAYQASKTGRDYDAEDYDDEDY